MICIINPIIVTTIVTIHAQPLPLSKPYETAKYMIPIINNMIPRTRGIMLNDPISIEVLELISVDDMEIIPANAIAASPPIIDEIPPIITRIAIMVTPIGLFVFVFKLNPILICSWDILI